MSKMLLLSAAQMGRIEQYFLLSQGIPHVDDPRRDFCHSQRVVMV